LLGGSLRVGPFVNADTIAKGLSAFRPEDVALDAARIMLRRLDELEDQRKGFAFETTLASRALTRRFSRLKAGGYTVHIVFLWLPTADLAIARVAERTRTGGHDVPSDTVRRRFARGLRNFFTVCRPIVDTWRLYDGSSIRGPRFVASGGIGTETRVRDPETWRVASEEYVDE
jgi:predicted ABC-type ATPase